MNDIYLNKKESLTIDKRRLFHLFLGSIIFLVIYFIDYYPIVNSPFGESIELTRESKAAIGILILAAYWWIAEIIPLGITGLVIGLIQVIFIIRPTTEVFANYMDPSVWFIFASLTIGTAFSKTGLTQRLAYFLLAKSSEHVSVIYLLIFSITLTLTLFMAHTAVAAAMFPLIITVHSLYSDKLGTKFGKGLFIGMAFSAGAGSIITLFGSARGAVGIDLLQKFTSIDIDFLTYSENLILPGLITLFTIWIVISLIYSPKEKRIHGLKNNVNFLLRRKGPISRNEILSILVMMFLILLLIGKSFILVLSTIHNSAILLLGAILLYILNILSLEDLEKTSWNIILLFGGSISLGALLWESGAAKYIAFSWLNLFQGSSSDILILSIIVLTLLLTNFIMNVASVSLILPIVLTMSEYYQIDQQALLFVVLSSAGMPFLFLTGAAPNAIAYQSKHFSTSEFFKSGVVISLFATLIIFTSYKLIW